TRMVPQDLASSGLDRIRIIRTGNIHDARNDNWRNLKSTCVSAVKDPLRSQLHNIFWCHLTETGVPASSVVAVIRKTIIPYALRFKIFDCNPVIGTRLRGIRLRWRYSSKKDDT